MAVSLEKIVALAPDQGSVDAARKLLKPGGWPKPATDGGNLVGDSEVREAEFPAPREGTRPFTLSCKDTHGKIASDEIRAAIGPRRERRSRVRDRETHWSHGRNLACSEPNSDQTRRARSGHCSD